MEVSKLPWKARKSKNRNYNKSLIVAANGMTVATVVEQEDAEFIIKAVNEQEKVKCHECKSYDGRRYLFECHECKHYYASKFEAKEDKNEQRK